MMVINSNQPRPIFSRFSIWRPVAAILENEKTLGRRLGASLLYPGGGKGGTAIWAIWALDRDINRRVWV